MAEAEEGEERGFEQQIESAVRSRLQHFRDQAASLTPQSVRRLLEKDLGLEKNALDTYKRFIRQYLEKQMDVADDLNSRTVAENVDKDINISKEEATGSPILGDAKRNSEKPRTKDQEMVDDSHEMSVLTPKPEADRQGSPVSKSTIEKAILERAEYLVTNSENITLAEVCRLLEEDLGLEKNTLNPYKKFIFQQIDQVEISLADKHVWDAYCESHKDAKKFQTNPFPNYRKLCAVVGKDCANGCDQETPLDIVEELDAETQEKETDYEGSTYEAGFSSFDRSSGNEGTSKRKRKRKIPTSQSVEEMMFAIVKAAEMLSSKMESSSVRLSLAIEDQVVTDLKCKLNDELKKLIELTTQERIKATIKIGIDRDLTHIFFTIDDIDKVEWVREVIKD